MNSSLGPVAAVVALLHLTGCDSALEFPDVSDPSGTTVTDNAPPSASNPNGTAPPALAFASVAPSVPLGSPVSLQWTGTSVENCQASGDWSGSQPNSGNLTIPSLEQDKTFTLRCNSADGSPIISMVSVHVQAATLQWDRPRANENGTTLTDLAGYNVRYGSGPGMYDDLVFVNDPFADSAVIELQPGFFHFVVAAVNQGGEEGAFSPEIVKHIP